MPAEPENGGKRDVCDEGTALAGDDSEAVNTGPRRPRRLKSYTLLASLLCSGLTLLTWTGQWYTIRVLATATGHPVLSITGDVAAPALIALSLAGLALVAALSIAGRVFRTVLGVLQVLIGVTVTFSAIIAVADPVKASASAISAATGVSGAKSIAALVVSVTGEPWPVLAIVAGVLTIAVGIFVIATAHRWPVSTDRYRQAVTLETDDPSATAVTAWDTLSGGSDPTSR